MPIRFRPVSVIPFAVALAALSLAGCEALAPFLAPAASAVASGVGAYEAQVRAAASAQGLPASDPKVLAAIAEAKKADAAAAVAAEKRDRALAAAVASARAEERQHAAEVAAALAKLGACPVVPAPVPAPVVDAGAAEGGR
jgi:hypothetical protein